MSNYDATSVFKNPIIQMTWSFHEISWWAASFSIFTLVTLTRAAVFFAHQSLHTFAQSRQETLSAFLSLSRSSGILRWALTGFP
jgi:hypothetical protein